MSEPSYEGLLELLAAQGVAIRVLRDRMSAYEDVMKCRQDATDITVLRLKERIEELEGVKV